MIRPQRANGWLTVATVLIAGTAAAAAATAPPLDCSDFINPHGSPSLEFLGPLRFLEAGNNRFAYRRFQLGGPRDATPLILMMGYGGSMSAWGPTLLARLAAHREVIIFDGVAQGHSTEVVPTTGPLTPPILEEGTLAFLDAINVTRPIVAGWSLGACAALKLAAHTPERVSKVISWAGTSPDGRAVVGSLSTMKALFQPDNSDEDYAAQNFNVATPEGKRGACFWLTDKRRMPDAKATSPEVNLRYSKGEALDRAGIMQAIKPWNWASWRALKRCTVPVLLMGGLEDAIIPPAAQTKLAAQIPGAWLAQFPGAGHGFLWQHMDQMLAVIEAFLGDGVAAPLQAAQATAEAPRTEL